MKPFATAATDTTTDVAGAANEPTWVGPLAPCAHPASGTIDLTPTGRRRLADALGQRASVDQALVLLRHAAVALYKHPEDRALRLAALRAADKARRQLLRDAHMLPQAQPATSENCLAELADALDRAELSIYLPLLHRERQLLQMTANWVAGNTAAREKAQGIEQERAQWRAQGARR